jgi:hypothetical protein
VQLWNFEQALRSGRFSEMGPLSYIREVKRIVITYDQMYLSNSILKDCILQSFGESGVEIPEDYHWHIMSSDELEAVLSVRDLNMFDLLKAKRLDATDQRMDFNDYLARNYADRAALNAYLNRITETFFDRFND